MSIFAHITDMRPMREQLADREEIRFVRQPNGTTVCSYVVMSSETFRCPVSREARGIVFDHAGQVIARPLHKFFNLNERPETRHDALPWSSVVRVMDKRDGSMIHTVRIPDGDRCFDVKSKKSFTSDVAVAAKTWLLERPNHVAFCEHVTALDETAIFEWTSPQARIVLPYQEDRLVLLHVRDNSHGCYRTGEELRALASRYGVEVVDESDEHGVIESLWRDDLSFLDTIEGVEGWVIQFADGEMIKLKTRWYLERHRAMTMLRYRDVAEMVLDECLDDLKSKLVGDGVDITEIEDIENRVVRDIDAVISAVGGILAADSGLTRKDFAIRHREHPLFGLLMKAYSGQEPDYRGYYRKHVLHNWDLTRINLRDSVAETE